MVNRTTIGITVFVGLIILAVVIIGFMTGWTFKFSSDSPQDPPDDPSGDAGSGDTPPPSPVNCQLSDWSAYDTCSKKNGQFTQTRSRTIVTQPKNGGAACGELTQTTSCTPPDGTPCDSGVSGRKNHYMNGQCVFDECDTGFTMKNNNCIRNTWYLPDGVGPNYLKYKSNNPGASCQGNGEWYNLDSKYFDNSVNCATTGCFDEEKNNFCFKRTTENQCNQTASGYYGRTPEERNLMASGNRDDRAKDCVWVPSLPADKIFNSEQDYLNAAT